MRASSAPPTVDGGPWLRLCSRVAVYVCLCLSALAGVLGLPGLMGLRLVLLGLHLGLIWTKKVVVCAPAGVWVDVSVCGSDRAWSLRVVKIVRVIRVIMVIRVSRDVGVTPCISPTPGALDMADIPQLLRGGPVTALGRSRDVGATKLAGANGGFRVARVSPSGRARRGAGCQRDLFSAFDVLVVGVVIFVLLFQALKTVAVVRFEGRGA